MKMTKPMRFGSICSGIEAASVAWCPLGMKAVWVSEIDPFANAVLKCRWPAAPNLGDITHASFVNRVKNEGGIDILVGGTPCQGFSTAGSRGGLLDSRSCLAIRFLEIASQTNAKWVVWENVPGALTTADGRDFGALLGRLDELGYRWAYRTLDAQFFGVPQQRRRIFLVGCRGSGCPGKVLFESDGENWNPSPSQKTKGKTTETDSRRASGVVGVFGKKIPTLCARGSDSSEDGTGRGNPIVAYQCHGTNVGPMGTLRRGNGNTSGGVPFIASKGLALRRMTPVEVERCQGFPDDYTLVNYRGKPAADGPRYMALGNSIAVPVLRWIGSRLIAVESGEI